MFFVVCALDNLEYFLLVFKVVVVFAIIVKVQFSYNTGQAFTVSVSLLCMWHFIWSFSAC